jgi:hypothetical protein
MLTGYGPAAQDSTVTIDNKVITLKEVIVRSNLNTAKFIARVQEDSTFYKAFKNLRILGYTSLNDIRMFDKKGKVKASLASRTVQSVRNKCRWTDIIEEEANGDIYAESVTGGVAESSTPDASTGSKNRGRSRSKSFNYYTAELYAGLFFAIDTICGESNIVGRSAFTNKGKSGIEKHKEQLKMLFFNPGQKIPGIPFIGDKIAIFEGEAADRYDFVIDMQPLKNEMCYVFTVVPRTDLGRADKKQIVINEMTTWFSIDNWEILARNYSLSYNAGVYDFNVRMEVELGHFKNLLVPTLLRYNGNWDVVFKKREHGVFTATLFDFK